MSSLFICLQGFVVCMCVTVCSSIYYHLNIVDAQTDVHTMPSCKLRSRSNELIKCIWKRPKNMLNLFIRGYSYPVRRAKMTGLDRTVFSQEKSSMKLAS